MVSIRKIAEMSGLANRKVEYIEKIKDMNVYKRAHKMAPDSDAYVEVDKGVLVRVGTLKDYKQRLNNIWLDDLKIMAIHVIDLARVNSKRANLGVAEIYGQRKEAEEYNKGIIDEKIRFGTNEIRKKKAKELEDNAKYIAELANKFITNGMLTTNEFIDLCKAKHIEIAPRTIHWIEKNAQLIGLSGIRRNVGVMIPNGVFKVLKALENKLKET